jgi:hypothetical protein
VAGRPRTARPAAADALLAPLIDGPPVGGHVVIATRLAVYAQLRSGGLVGVLAPVAVRVPGSLVAPGVPEIAAVHVGDEVVIGGGGLELAGVRLAPVRWWDSRVPRLAPPAEAPPRAPLPDAVGATAAALEAALLDEPDQLADVAVAVVGLGPGLTPAGDDVLAGALVALAATSARCSLARLASAVLPLRHRTTVLSAALLEHAAGGRAIPQLGRYVVGLARGPLHDDVVQDLERVGATSGAALAAGARIGIRVAAIGSERAKDRGNDSRDDQRKVAEPA